jgi:DNA-binding transcriptional LysR family regulator
MSWPSAMMIPRRMVRGLVSAGLGIALVPGIAAPAVPHGVRWIPVRDQGDALRRQVCAVTTPAPAPPPRRWPAPCTTRPRKAPKDSSARLADQADTRIANQA